MTPTPTAPRSRGVRRGGGAVLAAALVGTALLAPQAAFAADRDASLVSAPSGVFVDIGYCVSAAATCLQNDEGSADPTTVSDWTSFVNTQHEEAIVGNALGATPAGATLVVRNDGSELLSFDPNQITQVVSHKPDTTITLNGDVASQFPLAPVALDPGETWVYNIKGPDYGTGGQFRQTTILNPIDLALHFDTNHGSVNVDWSTTPSSQWVATIQDPKIVPGTVTDGLASGELSFDIDYRMSDPFIAWVKAREIESGAAQMLTSEEYSASSFIPTVAGLTMPPSLGITAGLLDYITGAETSIPGLIADSSALVGNTNIAVSSNEPISLGEVVPSALFHVEDIPVTWADGECLSFNIAGNIQSYISGWSVYGALNPATVALECAPPPTPEIDISKNEEGDDSQIVMPGVHPVTVTIRNTGEEALTNFVFTDTTESGDDVTWSEDDLAALAELTLEPGAEFVVNGTVPISTGVHRDNATVTANGVISGTPVDDEDPTELRPDKENPIVEPDIDISKNAEGDDSYTVDPGEHEVTVTITNTGTDTLTDFTFEDTTESGNDVVWSEEDLAVLAELELAPGEQFIVHGTVLVEDGVHRDEVLVNATGKFSFAPVEDDDPTEYVPEEPTTEPTPEPEDPEPGIDVSKNAEGDDSQVVEVGTHDVLVTIVNTGDEDLTDFVFEDTTQSGNDVVWNEQDLANLAELTLEPGDTFVVRGTVLVEDGTHRDEVTIDASGVISGTPVTDEDPTEYVPEEPEVPVTPEPEVPEPGIDVSKNAEGDDSQIVEAGEHKVTVTIVNNGEEDLTDFTFEDTTESGNDVVWSADDLAALAELTLAPGDSFIVHGTVLVEDGTHRDEVVIDATGVISGTSVSDDDPTELVPEEPEIPVIPEPEDPEPGLEVSKNDAGDDSHVVKAGTHEVTVTIVNDGEEALTGFTFTDTTESGNDVVWSEEDLAKLAELVLEPGETFVVHGTVLVDEGAHRDEVTIDASGVISGTPVSDEDPTELVPEEPETPVTPTPEPEEPVVPTPEPTDEPQEPTTPTPAPEQTVTPEAPEDPEQPSLAATGNDGSAMLPIAGGAGILLLAGILTLVIARRRSAARVHHDA